MQNTIDEVDELSADNEKIGGTLVLSQPSSSQLSCDDENYKTEIINYQDNSDEDLFNDSVNDLFSQCSQAVEDVFYKQPNKQLFSKEQLKHEEKPLGMAYNILFSF